jgi:anaerobic magnesium-protoporphyrin IX monomethyl ester cyclase
MSDLNDNLGTRRLIDLPLARFPSADEIVRERAMARDRQSKVDILLVNPPAPDGGIWIRSQHRVGRRSRENMIWPQVCLAQLASLLSPDFTVEIIDAIALRMGWKEFERILRDRRPRYYLTQVTAPSLTNDMYGVFLAKSLDAITLAFGSHVTPMASETLRQYPALDYVLRGEPELTLRELMDTLEVTFGHWQVGSDGQLINSTTGTELHQFALMRKMWREADPDWLSPWTLPQTQTSAPDGEDLPSGPERLYKAPDQAWLGAIKGLAWRTSHEIVINSDRPFIANLDDLPIPSHHLLPVNRYRAPLIKGPYSFIVTSRGCPGGCKYCIKHVNYQNSVRLRSPEKLIEEMWLLKDMGIHHIHMYADLFTVNRDQVVTLCKLIIQEGLKVTWTCNSRVDYVDEEMLSLMGRAGCTLISWGIESGNEEVLRLAHKGYRMDQTHTALKWAHDARIMNWGFFIIGLPGETVESIKETMALSRKLPLDIILFHVAAPYPGTPFFFEAIKNGWFRSGVNWEEVDMDQATVLDYPGLKAEELLYWQKRAFREWALRPKPIITFLKGMNSWQGFKSAIDIGLQTLGWVK